MDAKDLGPKVEQLLKKVRTDPKVLAAILYGSQARRESASDSDTDVCLVLPPEKDLKTDQAVVLEEYLHDAGSRLDIRVFQQLPLYIRSRVLREGVVLFCNDEDALYALAYRTAQAYEDFKPLYRLYLEQVADAGS
ncbi:MAG: type VII toxin-antitoxin system MntA family adenylyltransferase antitoxin [Nitrospiraceae bacterium]